MQRMRAIVLPIALLGLLLGCGKDTGGRVAVSGTITHQGQPLETGTIQFVAADGSQMSGAEIKAGKYRLPAEQGLMPGKFTVRVSAVKEASGGPLEAAGDSTLVEQENEELIPAEFNVNSTITADITDDSSNTFDLTIP